MNHIEFCGQNEWLIKSTIRCVQMKGKRFDPAFKKDIAQLYVNGNRSCASQADELGVQQYNENPEQAFPGSGNLKPDDDAMRKAQCRIKKLETEVDILKQAAVYFAKNSR